VDDVKALVPLLAALALAGCGSSSRRTPDAAVDAAGDAVADIHADAASDADVAPPDAPTTPDGNDAAAASDGAADQAVTVACGNSYCVAGQEYCYSFADLRPDAGTADAGCAAVPASCVEADASTACSCVLGQLQCQGSNLCQFQSGAVNYVSCVLN
jgi:hypothetical protein